MWVPYIDDCEFLSGRHPSFQFIRADSEIVRHVCSPILGITIFPARETRLMQCAE